MRIGKNPASEQAQLPGYGRHRVIIPVYIPELTGYFAHALDVLRICLESLWLTAADKANITIISNGSAPGVVKELQLIYGAGWIDQLLISHHNRGRVDALFSAARSAFEPVITFSDCDVLFRTGWLEAIDQILNAFPECGLVAPTPVPSTAWYYTSSTVVGALAERELMFKKVVTDDDLDRFADSVGNRDFFKPADRQTQLIAQRNGTVACVGCGHFIQSIRREALARLPHRPSLLAYRGERQCFDMPLDRSGYWRLSATEAYAYHIGNTPMRWMYDELSRMSDMPPTTPAAPALPPLRRHWTGLAPWPVRYKLAQLVRTSLPLVRRGRLRSLLAPT